MRRFRPSFSNVISIVALIVALTGSAAAATMALAVNNSDLRFGGHDSTANVVIKPNQISAVTVDSIHFTVPRRSSVFLNGYFTVTNTSSQPVTAKLTASMAGMPEKYTITQTIPAGATQQIPVGLLCNAVPAGKDYWYFKAFADVPDGSLTFGFRTVDITEWNPTKLTLGG
jgi:hypothetical protein